MPSKTQFTIVGKSIKDIPKSEQHTFFNEGEEITDELVHELALQGKVLPPKFIALCRAGGARYIRSRGSIVFQED